MVPRSYRKKDYRDQSLPLIGLGLFIGLVILMIAICARAQFSGVHQPMFSNAPISGQDYATNLAHRWAHTDLPTNVSFQVWTDKITQVHQFLVAGGGNMTNTTNGVFFTSAGASMTNRWGINSNLFNITGPLGGSTNYGMGILFRLTPGVATDFNIRNLLGDNTVNDGNPQYSIPNGLDTGPLNMYVAANSFLWAPNPLVTPSTQWFAMVWGATNNSTGNPFFVSYINGVYATNFGPDTGTGPFKNLGTRNVNPAIFTFNFKGWIKEVWVRTNAMTGGGMESMARDLNYVKTNIYGLP